LSHYFLCERHLKECPLRFHVVAVDNTPVTVRTALEAKSGYNINLVVGASSGKGAARFGG